MQERAQHAIFVEARHRVELFVDHLGEALGVVAAARVHRPRVEPGHEQLDETAREVAVRGERGLDVALAEQRAGLAQVLAVRAQERDFAPRESGAKHELVQAVVLGAASITLKNASSNRRSAAKSMFMPSGARRRNHLIHRAGIPAGVSVYGCSSSTITPKCARRGSTSESDGCAPRP